MRRALPSLVALVLLASGCERAGARAPGSAAAAKAPPRPTHPSPLGINVAPVVDWSTERPFLDLMKQSRAWISSSEGRWDDGRAIATDARGWPTRLEPGQSARTLVVWDVDAPPGPYVVTWRGQGTVDLAPQQVTSMAPGRATFTLAATRGIAVTITRTDPADPIRDVRVVPASLEASTARFHPDFLASLRPFSVIRFLDWMRANDATLTTWAQQPQVDDARYTGSGGVPVDVMIELANTLGADPWFTVPHTWDDAAIRAFAQRLKDGLKPELRAWVEHSNEVWNDAFPQARFARARGGALSDDANLGRLRFHSDRTVAVGRIFADVYGPARTARVVLVMGSMAVNAWASEQLLSWNDAFKSVDALAIAPYFGGSLGDAEQRDAVRALDAAGMTRALDAAVMTSLSWVEEQRRMAARFGVPLVAYEGGQHLVGNGAALDDEALARVLQRENRAPSMKGHYLRALQGWKERGGTLFVHYSSASKPTKHGSWGAREDVLQPRADAPKWDALLTFIEKTPRWW